MIGPKWCPYCDGVMPEPAPGPSKPLPASLTTTVYSAVSDRTGETHRGRYATGGLYGREANARRHAWGPAKIYRGTITWELVE